VAIAPTPTSGSVRQVQRFLKHVLRLLAVANGDRGTQVFFDCCIFSSFLVVTFVFRLTTKIREAVKEAIGHELHPSLYSMLFEQLGAIMDGFCERGGTEKVAVLPANTLFVDEAIKVVKMLLDNKVRARFCVF
jgi:hypothetical protein